MVADSEKERIFSLRLLGFILRAPHWVIAEPQLRSSTQPAIVHPSLAFVLRANSHFRPAIRISTTRQYRSTILAETTLLTHEIDSGGESCCSTYPSLHLPVHASLEISFWNAFQHPGCCSSCGKGDKAKPTKGYLCFFPPTVLYCTNTSMYIQTIGTKVHPYVRLYSTTVVQACM